MYERIKRMNRMKTETIIGNVDSMINYLLMRRLIIPAKNGKNSIEVFDDESCSMAEVRLNGECMMVGNYHDFHPGCHGGRLRVLGYLMGKPEWNSVGDVINLMTAYIQLVSRTLSGRLINDAVIEVREYSAKYGDDGKWRNKKLVETEITA